jgi:hypothetical protein
MTDEEFQKTILEKLNSMESRLNTGERQLSANTAMIKDLVHQTNELAARISGLLNSTATEAALTITEKRLAVRIDRIGSDLSFLIRKAAEHDDDIRELRQER